MGGGKEDIKADKNERTTVKEKKKEIKWIMDENAREAKGGRDQSQANNILNLMML